jgi:Methyltransferase domain
VQPDAEVGSLSRQGRSLDGAGTVDHEARARHDAPVVRLEDPSIDARRVTEVIGVDDQVAHDHGNGAGTPGRIVLTMSTAIRRRQWLARLRRPAWLGTIRRTSPLSDHWGRERGTPVDRYYVERFLGEHGRLITGRVLEVMDAQYTRTFGANVSGSEVLDIDAGNAEATIVADLAAADAIESSSFDCFVLTQTLQYVFDVEGAVAHVHRILRPGGTVLCTVPLVSRIGRAQIDTEYWRFTPAACRRLFEKTFSGGTVDVRGQGNLLTCVAFLVGMAAEELSARELEAHDRFFPLLVTVRATKAREARSAGVESGGLQ